MKTPNLTTDQLDRLLDAVDSPDERLAPAGLTEAAYIHYIAGILPLEEEFRVCTALRNSPSLADEAEEARALLSAKSARSRTAPRDFGQNQRTAVAFPSATVALAASERTLPETMRLDALIPGMEGEASASAVAPGSASTLRVSFAGSADPRPTGLPLRLAAVWPGGQSEFHELKHRSKRWRLEIEVPHPWSRVCDWIETKVLGFTTED